MAKQPSSTTGNGSAILPNPWDALFASATRSHPAVPSVPIHDAGTAATSSDVPTCQPPIGLSPGSYTILIQHSMTPKSQRQWALASTMAMTTEHARSKSSASKIMMHAAPPSSTRRSAFQGNFYGISGSFLARQSFEDLCHQCDGAVVYVSVLGTSGVFDLDEIETYSDRVSMGEPENYNEVDEYTSGGDSRQKEKIKRFIAIKKFLKNGMVVDLASNPFGWEDEDCAKKSRFVAKSTMSDLASVAKCIRQAATLVEFRRSQSQSTRQPKSKNVTEMQKPIPIIFETMTPLVHAHGVEKVGLLIKMLGRSMSANSLVSIAGKDLFLGEEATPKQIRPPIISPIVAPTLYESLRPSDHRVLEDLADAMLSLNVLNVDSDSGAVPAAASGVLEVVRKGGGGTGLGGKFIRDYVTFHILREATRDSGDGCHWVLESDESNDIRVGKTKSDVAGKMPKDQSAIAGSGKNSSYSNEPTTPISRPRIYLEDNDPEFDDFDEEDPDDDLDL